MIVILEVSADSADNARAAAVSQWRAQGYTRVEAVMTRPIGDRRYQVQATVSR